MAPRVYAALYIRKSNETEEQKSLKDQIAEGREYCKRMGWTLRDEHIFIDEESAYLKPAEKRQAFIDLFLRLLFLPFLFFFLFFSNSFCFSMFSFSVNQPPRRNPFLRPRPLAPVVCIY